MDEAFKVLKNELLVWFLLLVYAAPIAYIYSRLVFNAPDYGELLHVSVFTVVAGIASLCFVPLVSYFPQRWAIPKNHRAVRRLFFRMGLGNLFLSIFSYVFYIALN